MIAAKYGNVHIAKALINKGASILKENKSNMRAIDFARIYENVEVYEYLLELEG
jgi:ankyrin repeat protein